MQKKQEYTLYFDEAGYTGSDLTNEEQPYFCLASCLYKQKELQQIKSDFPLSGVNKELHFSKMVSSAKGRLWLVEILRHPLITEERIITSLVHKRFCIYAQIVNTLIETYLFEHDISIYRDNMQLSLANLLYNCAIAHPNHKLIKCLESQFVNMMRFRDEYAVNQFFQTIDALLKDSATNNCFNEILSFVKSSREVLDNVLVDDKFYLDNTVTLFATQLSLWYTKAKAKFDVLLDSSKPIEDKRELLLRLRDTPRTKESRLLSSEAFTIPLPFNNIYTVDSTRYFGIQIADVIASALCYYVAGKLSDYKDMLTEIEKHTFFTSPNWSIYPGN